MKAALVSSTVWGAVTSHCHVRVVTALGFSRVRR